MNTHVCVQMRIRTRQLQSRKNWRKLPMNGSVTYPPFRCSIVWSVDNKFISHAIECSSCLNALHIGTWKEQRFWLRQNGAQTKIFTGKLILSKINQCGKKSIIFCRNLYSTTSLLQFSLIWNEVIHVFFSSSEEFSTDTYHDEVQSWQNTQEISNWKCPPNTCLDAFAFLN